MREAIKNFPKQFSWEPKIENEDQLLKYSKFVVAGMGGSSLAGDLLKVAVPILDITVHRDYGLPDFPDKDWDQTLVIASSYSGNTEETLDALDMALKNGVAMAVIAAGGKLLEKAKNFGLPYVELPNTGVQPRMATGFSTKALLAILGMDEALKEISGLANLDPGRDEKAGVMLAKKLAGKVPVIYASRRNFPVANNWKIKFNETGKTPAFANFFSELNHNEMTGFAASTEASLVPLGRDSVEASKKLSQNFHFIFLKDSEDHPRHQKRMEVTAKLYRDRGLEVEEVEFAGRNVWEKIFVSTLLADWTALSLAEIYGADPENVPLVEEFKKLINRD